MPPPPPIGFAKEAAEAVPPAVDTTALKSGVVAKAAEANAAETKAAEANAGAKAAADEPATGHEDANSVTLQEASGKRGRTPNDGFQMTLTGEVAAPPQRKAVIGDAIDLVGNAAQERKLLSG